jgi:hypothetical protein
MNQVRGVLNMLMSLYGAMVADGVALNTGVLWKQERDSFLIERAKRSSA